MHKKMIFALVLVQELWLQPTLESTMFTEGLDAQALRWVQEVGFANFLFAVLLLP